MQKQFEELGKSAEELEGQFQEFEKVETEEQPPSSLKASNDQSYWKLSAAWEPTRRLPAVSAEAAKQPRHLTIVKLLM